MEKRWLVAVGPEGMILAEGEFDKELIESKAAIGLMTCRELAEMELEAEYVEWYSASLVVKDTYQKIRTLFPEDIYVTLEELDEENFTKEMERRNTDMRKEKAQQSEIRLYFTKDLNEPGERISLGKAEPYVGNIGTQFLLNQAFRKVNQKLEKIEKGVYTELSWHYEGKKSNHIDEEIFRFAKKAADGKYAVLEVKDCRRSLNL